MTTYERIQKELKKGKVVIAHDPFLGGELLYLFYPSKYVEVWFDINGFEASSVYGKSSNHSVPKQIYFANEHLTFVDSFYDC